MKERESSFSFVNDQIVGVSRSECGIALVTKDHSNRFRARGIHRGVPRQTIVVGLQLDQTVRESTCFRMPTVIPSQVLVTLVRTTLPSHHLLPQELKCVLREWLGEQICDLVLGVDLRHCDVRLELRPKPMHLHVIKLRLCSVLARIQVR